MTDEMKVIRKKDVYEQRWMDTGNGWAINWVVCGECGSNIHMNNGLGLDVMSESEFEYAVEKHKLDKKFGLTVCSENQN